MNSCEKKARIVCLTKSVEVTRVIPSRYAASVATVDLPVPVAPPTRTITGRSRSCSSRRRRSLGAEVDRGGFDLDEIDVGIGTGEILDQLGPVREVARHGDDVGIEVVGRCRAGREDCDTPRPDR